jgi:hypothetical protein
MKAKFKVGDTLKGTASFVREGKKLFGNDFEYTNFKSKVVKVYENNTDARDGQGDIIPNMYIFEDGNSLCEKFLEIV